MLVSEAITSLVFRVRREDEPRAEFLFLIIGSTCCAESEAGLCSSCSLSLLMDYGEREQQKHCGQTSNRDVPVRLLEPYANPLLNFIFLIPLIRSRGIKPAGRNPC